MNENTSTAMTIGPESGAMVPNSQAFEPQSFDALMSIAEMFHASNMFPKLRSVAAVATIIVTGREFGFTAAQALRLLTYFDGKVQLPADTAVALVKNRPQVCEYFICTESTAERVTYETKRPGDPKAQRHTFTIDDAKRADLLGKDNWKKYPNPMMHARAKLGLARIAYPELTAGIYDPDEMQRDEPRVRSIVARAIGNVDPEPHIETAEVDADEPSVVTAFAERLASCASSEQIDALATEAKALDLDRPTRLALADAFKAARARVTEAA